MLPPTRGGLLTENLRMAMDALLSTKLRSLLTVLGILIGVATVVAMSTVITGIGRSMKEQIAALGSGVLYVSKEDAGFQIDDSPVARRRDLTTGDAEALQACPSVRAVSAEIKELGRVGFAGAETPYLAWIGATEQFPDANSWEPAQGRFFTREEVRHAAPVCVLGHSPATQLFPHGGALGAWVQIEGRRMQVVGLLEEKGKFLGQSMDDVAVTPLPLVARVMDLGDAITYVVVRPSAPDRAEAAREELTELLRRRRGLAAQDPNDFGVTSQESLFDLYQQVTGAFFLVTLVISSIGLLVGGIGVMNMMLISVHERTREIGIRLALGARRKDISAQFLTEAVALTSAGGLLGLVLGFALAAAIGAGFHVPLAISTGGTLASLGTSAAIGLFFGLYPAWRAARLDPIEALRNE